MSDAPHSKAHLEILRLKKGIAAAEARGRKAQREADAAIVRAKGCACHWSQESALPEFPAEGAPIFEKAHPMDRYSTKVIRHGECCPIALADAILEGSST